MGTALDFALVLTGRTANDDRQPFAPRSSEDLQ